MTEGLPQVARVEPGEVRAALVTALHTAAIVSRAEVGVITLTGPGAAVYGALLTPKGMIVVDAWATRLGSTVSYTVPAAGRESAVGIFTRSIPPRLARVVDRTEDVVVYRLAGPGALAVAAAAGLDVA